MLVYKLVGQHSSGEATGKRVPASTEHKSKFMTYALT